MRVKIWEEVCGTDNFAPGPECDLPECFPDDADSRREAEADLLKSGFHFGGGAAPCFMLERVS
ncbi:MAG TPA: hypothetical protein VKW08_08050 [Xanthobacteraceae bacterium]|jgi:hypothetical protein|nr:hypothetical protein [Xanthobacteraceae bacterium]